MKIEQRADRPLTWFKSSYSGDGGANCVEVAVEWIKSSYSGGAGGNCVEVALCPAAVHIRDSKDPDKGTLSVSPAAWSAFVDSARHS